MDLFEARNKLIAVFKEMIRVAPIRYKKHQERRLKRINEIGEEIKKLPALERDQDRVRDNYIKEFNLTKKESDKLQMFSSPLRIMEGLTWERVRICIHLHDLMYPTGSMLNGRYEELGKAILYFEAEFPNDPFTAFLKQVLQAKNVVESELKKSDDFRKHVEALPKEQREAFNAMMRGVLGIANDIGKKCDERTG